MSAPDLVLARSTATWRRRLGFALLAAPALLTSLDLGALFLALPRVSVDLDATTTQQLWISDIYGFTLAASLVTMGNLADRLGRRRVLLAGAAAFGVLSVAAAYATSAAMLIATRAVLGIAGASLMPAALALTGDMFPGGRQRARATTGLYICVMAGSVAGPAVGGLLLARFWWGSVFLLGVPFMLLLVVAGPVLLPVGRHPSAARLDPVSVLLSLFTVLPLVSGMKQLAAGNAVGRAVPVAAIAAGLLCGVIFVRRQRRAPSPLLDLRLLGNRAVAAVLAALLLAGACMAGTYLLISQYVQNVLRLSSGQSGLVLTSNGLSLAVGLSLAPRFAERTGTRSVIAGGLAIGSLGFVLVAAARGPGALALTVIGLSLAHLCAGPLLGLGVGLVIATVPAERAGSAASLAETGNYLGSMLGVAVLGSLSAALYHHLLTVPPGVPAQEAGRARQTVASAVAVTHQLPAPQADVLLHSSASAFQASLHAAGVVGAVVFASLSALTARTLAHRETREAVHSGDASSLTHLHRRRRIKRQCTCPQEGHPAAPRRPSCCNISSPFP